MQLNIGDKSYDIFESITHSKLGDLRTLERESTQRGTLVSINGVRSYLIDDVMSSEVAFGYVDSDEKITKLGGLIFLCRRHAGEDAHIDDVDQIELADLSITFDVPDGEASPKEQTASDQDGSTETRE